MSAVKQAGGKGQTERGKQTAAQKKKPSTTSQAPTTQPASLAADAFGAALAAMPSQDCLQACLPADRTIMLRMASKRVREIVDKARLAAVVRLSRGFWVDTLNGTVAERLTHNIAQLATMATRYRITRLELPRCQIQGQDAERLASVLAECPALAHLDLS